jgi:hypothetical protein
MMAFNTRIGTLHLIRWAALGLIPLLGNWRGGL